MSSPLRATVARLLSSAGFTNAGLETAVRSDNYGNLGVVALLSGIANAAIAGKYFTATEGTIGTAVATTTSITAFSATKPVFLCYNSGSRDIVFDFLNLMVVQVPTSATSWQFAWTTDNSNRYSSAGTAVTPKNVNGNADNVTGAVVYIGDITAAAAGTAVRNHSSGACRGIIPTTFDQMGFRFGGAEGVGSGLMTTGSAKYIANVPPLVLAPGHSAQLSMFGASNAAAPSFLYTFGYAEL